jgi:hypothetical protein
MVLVQSAPTAPLSLGEWCMVHADGVNAMSKVSRGGPGRPKGAPNKITRDIRTALRDLAEGNAHRVQKWLDRVAENDPAEALRLWLGLLRYVTPTLQAAAIADLRKAQSPREQLAAMTDAELNAAILSDPEIQARIERKSCPQLTRAEESAVADSRTLLDDELFR